MSIRNLNRLAKWRMVFASWQLGTRADTDPECQAVRDHREATLVLRVEMNALTELLVRKGVITAEQLTDAVEREAVAYEQDLQRRFPGFKATDVGMEMDPQVAVRTMRGWRP